MTIFASVLIAAMLAGSYSEAKPISPAAVIGIYGVDFSNGCEPGKPDVYAMTVIGAFQNGSWLKSDFLTTDPPWVSKSFKPEKDAFLGTLVNQTFYLCPDPSVTFHAQEKTIATIITTGVLGLRGVLSGDRHVARDYAVSAMVNTRSACGTMKKGDLGKGDKRYVLQRTKERVSEDVRKSESDIKERPRPTFDGSLYQEAEIVEAFDCALRDGWRGIWVHAKVAYPQEKAPTPVVDGVPCPWSGDYYAVLDARRDRKRRVLWECAVSYVEPFGASHFDLLGVCDVNGNGKPELVIDRSQHECREYMILELRDGKFEQVAALSGSV